MERSGLFPQVLQRLQQVSGPDGQGWHTAICPLHEDRKPSLRLTEVGFVCHGCGQKGAITDLAERLGVETDGQGKSQRQVSATYDYRNDEGQLLFQVVRFKPKGFAQRRPDGKGGWAWDLKGVRWVLYRLPELLAAPADTPVFVPEGEKDVDRLANLGLVATTNPAGAGKWPYVPDLMALRGRHVVVLPDKDAPGRRHARQVAGSLKEIAASVKVLELPGLPEKGDVSDWLGQGHTAKELLDLTEMAPEWRLDQHNLNDQPPQLQVVTVADVRPRQVTWLWPRRLPRGKLTIVAGDPGLGKSYLTLDIAARVSLGGPWPDGGQVPQGNVLIISAEDGLEDTIRPRLDLLDADLGRIHAVSAVVGQGEKQVSLSLAEHLFQLELAVLQHRAVLLVLDPLLAFTGRGTDTHKSSEVRAVLAPLASMAERTGCAVLAVFHLNKRAAEVNSIYRITASLDFAAAARSVLVVGKHPGEESRRVLAPVKSNLAGMPSSLAFHITDEGHFRWDGEVELDAEAVLAPPVRTGEEETTALAEARSFLEEVLGNGLVETKAVLREAREAGIKERTLERAKAELEVMAIRKGQPGKRGGGHWYWTLPGDLDRQSPGSENPGGLNEATWDGDEFEAEDGKESNDAGIVGERRIKAAKPGPQEKMAPLIPEGGETPEAAVWETEL